MVITCYCAVGERDRLGFAVGEAYEGTSHTNHRGCFRLTFSRKDIPCTPVLLSTEPSLIFSPADKIANLFSLYQSTTPCPSSPSSSLPADSSSKDSMMNPRELFMRAAIK